MKPVPQFTYKSSSSHVGSREVFLLCYFVFNSCADLFLQKDVLRSHCVLDTVLDSLMI